MTKLFSFKKELFKASVYSIIAIAFANLIFFSIYYYPQNKINIIVLIILEIITLYFTYTHIATINKRKLQFIKDNSELEHIIDNDIDKDHIIEKIKQYGYSMYSINNSRVFIDTNVIKKNKSIKIDAYSIFVIDVDRDTEAILNTIKNEYDEIFDLYIDDNKKKFKINSNSDDENKETILKAHINNHSVFIFVGENIPSRLIEMSKNGYIENKLLNINSHIFTVSYIIKEKKLIFAEAVEHIKYIHSFPKDDFIYIIKDIFYIKN